ncbi:hypothetical protein HDU83_002510 [Entophlyctis luteolus]|nr:hypothetical protein HDU82_005722 [Entophlyctis luteolus]KAJ3355862.1 hypothetical protein HDU83_002510 [Entophlyctis luteolus]
MSFSDQGRRDLAYVFRRLFRPRAWSRKGSSRRVSPEDHGGCTLGKAGTRPHSSSDDTLNSSSDMQQRQKSQTVTYATLFQRWKEFLRQPNETTVRALLMGRLHAYEAVGTDGGKTGSTPQGALDSSAGLGTARGIGGVGEQQLQEDVEETGDAMRELEEVLCAVEVQIVL